LGDLTPNQTTAILCPENRAGKVNLMLTDHGGRISKAIFCDAAAHGDHE
jgi:hypothetical protein